MFLSLVLLFDLLFNLVLNKTFTVSRIMAIFPAAIESTIFIILFLII